MSSVDRALAELRPAGRGSRSRGATRWVHTALVTGVLGAVAGCTGTIDGAAADAGQGDGAMDRQVEIDGPPVLPHVQGFANAACGAVGACQPSTYDGHHPSADRAVDLLTSEVYGEVPSDGNALGDAVAALALARQPEFGIWYVIWRQRINFGAGWEAMEDRGSITQNHYDHVHVSFDATPPP